MARRKYKAPRNYDGPDVDLEVEVQGEKIQVTAYQKYNRALDIFQAAFRIKRPPDWSRPVNVCWYGHPDFDPDFYAAVDRAVWAALLAHEYQP